MLSGDQDYSDKIGISENEESVTASPSIAVTCAKSRVDYLDKPNTQDVS
jgi:hypothetical protein